jgi:hypothetical protein
MFMGLPDPRPDPLVRGTDTRIRIRIRTQMSRIPTGLERNLKNTYVMSTVQLLLYRLEKFYLVITIPANTSHHHYWI